MHYYPGMYNRIKNDNRINKDIIEKMGGVENTLKEMEESLKHHEMRPFDF